MAEQVNSHPVAALAQSETRRAWYIKSMQSARVKVLVAKDTFEVPSDLLAHYSTSFKKQLNPLDDSGDEISLPDVTKPTFDDFFIWLHAYEPTILHNEDHDPELVDGALNLAVFAQRYHIYHLRNQASDVVRSALIARKWNITPDMISAVYKVAPAGSALRQLCFLGFVAGDGRKDTTVWQAAFKDCSDLGWDFFQYNSGNELYSEGVDSGGACRFHDHKDIRGWVLQVVDLCPYRYGAPLLTPEDVVVSASAPAAVVSDVIVNDVEPSSKSEAKLPLSSVEEAVEPEAVENQRTEEPVVEASPEIPSEAGCWASETTETEPVEVESVKFEPAEEPLVEETTVSSWVSKTEGAEPVEVQNFPVEEDLSHVAVANEPIAVEPEAETSKDIPLVSKVTLKRLPIVEETLTEKEPVVEEISVLEKTPTLEEAEPIQDSSVPMARRDSMISNGGDPLSPSTQKGKRKGKKGRR